MIDDFQDDYLGKPFKSLVNNMISPQMKGAGWEMVGGRFFMVSHIWKLTQNLPTFNPNQTP